MTQLNKGKVMYKRIVYLFTNINSLSLEVVSVEVNLYGIILLVFLAQTLLEISPKTFLEMLILFQKWHLQKSFILLPK